MSSRLERIFRRLKIIGPRDRLVKVYSWRPCIYRDRGRLELTWPALLIDQYGYQRCNIAPIWDRARFLAMFRKEPAREG